MLAKLSENTLRPVTVQKHRQSVNLKVWQKDTPTSKLSTVQWTVSRVLGWLFVAHHNIKSSHRKGSLPLQNGSLLGEVIPVVKNLENYGRFCGKHMETLAMFNFTKDFPQNTTVIQSEHTKQYSKSSFDRRSDPRSHPRTDPRSDPRSDPTSNPRTDPMHCSYDYMRAL